MTLSEWVQSQANAIRLEACQIALANFCAAADKDSRLTLQVGYAVCQLLIIKPGTEDPLALLATIRTRMSGLDPENLEVLGNQLLEATSDRSKISCEAGKLVSCWLRAIALSGNEAARNSRALRVARLFEKTFASMARLLARSSVANGAADCVQNAS